VPLDTLKKTPGREEMMVIKKGSRLSEQPATRAEVAIVTRLGRRARKLTDDDCLRGKDQEPRRGNLLHALHRRAAHLTLRVTSATGVGVTHHVRNVEESVAQLG